MPAVKHHEDEDETAFPLLATESDAAESSTGRSSEGRPSDDYPHLRQQVLHHVSLEHSSGSRRNDDRTPPKLRRRTPLPLLQLFILFATRLSEPIAYTQIFPVRHFFLV